MWVSLESVIQVKSVRRKKQTSYINAYVLWHIYNILEKWSWWTYLQGSNRDNLESGPVGTAGKGRVGWTERAALMYTHHHVQNRWRKRACSRVQSPARCPVRTCWAGLGAPGKGDIRAHTADAHRCTAETHPALQSNYTPMKMKIFF